MEVIRDISDLRQWNKDHSRNRRVLVPTMGALHRGHTSLMDIARENASDSGRVVTTIFVNPTQFGPGEDLDAYPKTFESDLEKCREHGVDLVFAPEAKSVYADDRSIEVRELRLSKGLCGASRPVHFTGVCTVVAKLFNLTQPDAAVFGEKDYQQLAIIRRMVRDLNFPIDILAGVTVREEDGLALSSRNVYLTPEERTLAPVIREALIAADDASTFGEAEEIARSKIAATKSAKIDYLSVVDPDTLEMCPPMETGLARMIVAVFFGKTRLIDNRQIDLSVE